MSKQKRRYDGEANFISELPLEECAYRLEYLQSDEIEIHIKRVSTDKVDFDVRLFERGRVRAEGKGALRRWEGTLTRVDCQVNVYDGLVTWSLAMLLFMALPLLIVPFLFLVSANVDATLWVASAGVVLAFILLGMYITREVAPPDDTPRNLLALIEDTLR